MNKNVREREAFKLFDKLWNRALMNFVEERNRFLIFGRHVS